MYKEMGMYTLHKGFWEDKHIFSGFHSSVMWSPTVYELVWPQGLFGWPPDHMGWFALLLLVKFKTPGWFHFISYSYQVVHFGGWEHCVKIWWVTRSKSKVSRPLFSLVLAGDMICFVVKSKNLKVDMPILTCIFFTNNWLTLTSEMHFVKFHPEISSCLLSRGERKYAPLGMGLIWKYIRNYFLVYQLISHFLSYLQNYKEFKAKILDLQPEKYGLSFDIKKCTTSGWALGDENVIGIRAFNENGAVKQTSTCSAKQYLEFR